jgi:hypothetical protein
VTISVAALISLILVLGSHWARRRADTPGPRGTHYRRTSRLLALAALAVALLALWKVLDDHRQTSAEAAAGAQPTQP